MEIWTAMHRVNLKVTTTYKHLAKLEKDRLVNFFKPLHKIREWGEVIMTGQMFWYTQFTRVLYHSLHFIAL